MRTPHFDTPTTGNGKVSLAHVTLLNGPRPQAVVRPSASEQALQEERAATLILVGLDDQGKPHASWFEEEQADAAAVAADLMGFAIIDVSGVELTAIATALPKGKLFESGKAFVPFVKRTVYDRLATYLDDDYLTTTAARVDAAQAAASETYASASKGEAPLRKPEDWSKLLAGDLVLATEDRAEGWFEAVIVELVDEDKVKLRWRDYPDYPHVTCKIVEVALLHPQSSFR